jgi:hypothetical protein
MLSEFPRDPSPRNRVENDMPNLTQPQLEVIAQLAGLGVQLEVATSQPGSFSGDVADIREDMRVLATLLGVVVPDVSDARLPTALRTAIRLRFPDADDWLYLARLVTGLAMMAKSSDPEDKAERLLRAGMEGPARNLLGPSADDWLARVATVRGAPLLIELMELSAILASGTGSTGSRHSSHGRGTAPSASTASSGANNDIENIRKIPTAFISYSWDSEDHKAWVKGFATQLRLEGVDVTLDQWHVALGDQLPEFMERSIQNCDFVLMVCTPGYKARADGRKGGAGYEGHVITAAVYNGADQRKFVPVWRSGDEWTDAAPSWLGGKSRVDLREPAMPDQFQLLLKHLHGEYEKAPAVVPRKRHPT